ncbi:lipocalin-like domain-containing protein [Flavivirga algicola]|uniref:Lipocalin family protein n=1 Tax=Flavivirga algicola TaxID=2729136 RepID=A0ABX1S1U2_9FLAO|nr:lipocalin family protein [Flavivirga algicola]NMH89807.1 lipocalin family protein [Flavivirga algicola]
MKKILFAISVMLCFMNMKCSDDDTIHVDSDNLLIGSWAEPVYDAEKITFKKVAKLPEEDYGILFKDNGSFVVRSSGWCGTPPLVFFDSNGTWKLDNTLITITQDQYPSNYIWRIVSLTANELVVKRELTEQEEDHRELMDLFDEIYQLSISVSCTDSADWTFTAYGAKACGGPQGYIAYSTQIDTAAFLQKIEVYTNLEKAYNIKWGIASTCDLPKQPKGVVCENGFPVLKY